MDSTERAHIESLLQLHRAHLRELELKAAKYGGLDVPTHITLQIAEYRQNIAELEERTHADLPRHNLPPRDYEQFIGRQKELADVRKLLLPYPKSRYHLVTIDGIGGIGKSALALETAYTFVDQYAALPASERFEAIVWVSAKRSYLTADGILERRQVFRTLDDLYAAIAQVFDYPAITRAKAEEQRVIVEEILREKRTLLILDNLETVDDEGLLVFLRELPDPTKAIVTTRHRIDVAYPMRLSGMPHEDALTLIAQEAVRKNVMIDLAEQEQLWQRTGGVPLAIVWSIGLIGLGGSVESVLRRLGSGQSDIARFCFEESVAQIRGRDAYTLLLSLSLFATDASRDALGAVAGLAEDEFGRDMGLEDLLRLSLVNKEGQRFSILPLTQSFIRVEAVAHAEWMEGATERWQQHFYTLISTVGGWTQNWSGQDLVELELLNVFSVIQSISSNIRYQQLDESEQIIDPSSTAYAKMFVDLTDKVARTCRLRGYWHDCERLSQAAIRISKALNYPVATGWRYHDLARISYFRRETVVAKKYAQQARGWGEQSGNRNLINRANLLLGLIALQDNNIDEASIILRAAFNDYEAMQGTGERFAFPNFIAGLGELAEHQGNVDEAATWYREGIDHARRNDHLSHLASNLLSLGRVQLARDNMAEANTCYTESLKTAQECGRVDVIAKALYSIATIASDQRVAKSNAHQALGIFRRLGMKREQAEAEALLARINSEASSS